MYSPCGNVSFALMSNLPMSRNADCALPHSAPMRWTYSSGVLGSAATTSSALTRSSPSRTGAGAEYQVLTVPRALLLFSDFLTNIHIACISSPPGLFGMSIKASPFAPALA